jgi:hypothetical protein
MHYPRHTSIKIERPKVTIVNAVHPLFLALVTVCYVSSAHASLGGDSASVEADRLHMNVKHAARLTQPSTGSYTVHETTLPSGTLVRQYVSKAGVVFAVTWSGPFMPNLRQLMGPHFDTMVARQAKRDHAIHRSIRQHESDLVIESGGHPRSFAGRAYLPSALPVGVAEKDIQ